MKKFILFASLLLISLTPISLVASKTFTSPPDHGYLNLENTNFECNRGYSKNLETNECDLITLPENALLTNAGNDWRCIDTYKRVGDSCTKVELPKNAQFFDKGYDWFCYSGYQKEANECVKIELPTNARLDYSGNNWLCVRGYKKSKDEKSCVKIDIPQNATANYIGGFTCNGGYKLEGGECKKVSDIENGRFYEYGSDFYCLEGYLKNEDNRTCEKITVPNNAHQDNLALEGWACNGGYINRNGTCEKFDLPEHAYWFNDNWGCELGFRKNPTANTCEKISLPENAHYTDTYDGWLCNDGYTKNYKENHCDKN